MTEHKLAQFEQFVRVLEKRLETPATGRSEVHLTPYLIRAEFQIRAEIERLRLDLHRHVNQHQQLRLLNNPDNPKAAG
jgi:hypothetical protein